MRPPYLKVAWRNDAADLVPARFSLRNQCAAMHGAADAKTLVDRLAERGLTLATAEAACGGLLAARFVDIPGASRAFAGGIVSYGERGKTAILGLSREFLLKHGAVSLEVAAGMAAGARQRFGTDIGLAESGIAGPQAGRHSSKPVGSVAVGVVTRDGFKGRIVEIGPGARPELRTRFVDSALLLLGEVLEGKAT